ncbi:MAG: response regulator [Xanthomonadaceae bacterium]|nr:response regulator [Xanthomonadaceae bacterium]
MSADRSDTGTIIIVDDDPAVRESMATLMRAAGYRTNTYSSGKELFQASIPEGPICLLLDLQLPGADGIEIQQSLIDNQQDLPVLFLTGHADVPSAVTALRRGAIDYIEKMEFDPADLLRRVAGALKAHGRRLAERSARDRLYSRIAGLSPRELEVASLAADGQTNKAIGLTLGISERTVEVHRGRAMKKLDLRTVADLARLHAQLVRHGNLQSD